MARAPTTADAFSAIAEPKRRHILGLLASSPAARLDRGLPGLVGGFASLPIALERDVTWFVKALGWPQPQVSKHLGVLRKVGLVTVTRKGRCRMYSLNAQQLRPVHDWVKNYERFWEHQLDRIKTRAERVERESKTKERESKA